MREYRIVDADCHILEPPHIWKEWLPKQYVDQAPQLVKDADGGDAWKFDKGGLMHIGLVATPGMSFEQIKWTGYGYDDIRRGCYDGKARLEDMDFDGVDAEAIYPSQRTMFHFMGNEDEAFHLAGIQAYNNFMSDEFCASDPERLLFLAQMPNLGVDAMIAEMKRCKDKGARGVIISTWPEGGDHLTEDDFPFFEAAVEMGMPVHIHILIRRPGDRPALITGSAAIASMALAGYMRFPINMCDLIFSGVFDRVPGLKIVGAETEAGWVPEVLEQVDNFYWRNRTHTEVSIKEIPSWYFRHHFLLTFLQDHYAMRNRHAIGVRNMAWCSDYPHHGNDWPYSRKVISEQMSDCSALERYLMTAGNMVELYGLPQAYEPPVE